MTPRGPPPSPAPAALTDVARALKNHSIADRLTDARPALTLETINPLRTIDQMNISGDDARS